MINFHILKTIRWNITLVWSAAPMEAERYCLCEQLKVLAAEETKQEKDKKIMWEGTWPGLENSAWLLQMADERDNLLFCFLNYLLYNPIQILVDHSNRFSKVNPWNHQQWF